MKAMISHLSVVTIKDQPKSVTIENQAYLFVPMTKYEIPLKTIKHFSTSVKSHHYITLYGVETYIFLLFHILYAHFDTFQSDNKMFFFFILINCSITKILFSLCKRT